MKAKTQSLKLKSTKLKSTIKIVVLMSLSLLAIYSMGIMPIMGW